jgi:hypothetical protein
LTEVTFLGNTLKTEELPMSRLLGMSLLLLGAASFAFGAAVTPEIDAGSAGSALTLLSGGLLVYRASRRAR